MSEKRAMVAIYSSLHVYLFQNYALARNCDIHSWVSVVQLVMWKAAMIIEYFTKHSLIIVMYK
jgi:hypothetical protein